MLVPNIFGNYDTRDLPRLRIGDDGVTEAQVVADIQAWAAFFEKAVNQYVNSLSITTTQAKGLIGTGTAGGELQPYTEYGNTQATEVESNEWDYGLPIRRYRDKQIYTEEFVATATLAQISKDTIAANNRYYTTRLKMLLRAILRNTSYQFKDDKKFPREQNGTLQCYPLFNADSTLARFYVENDLIDAGALQSYKPTNVAGISRTNFTMGRSELKYRGCIGRVVHIISRADADAVRAMTGFFRADNPSAAYLRTTNPTGPITAPIITEQPEAIGTFADGLADGEVVAWPFFPSGYVLSYDGTKEPPLAFRNHSLAQFQGFRLINNDTGAAYGTDALRNKTWEFIGGVAVRNRLNGVVTQGTTGSYTIPAIPTS